MNIHGSCKITLLRTVNLKNVIKPLSHSKPRESVVGRLFINFKDDKFIEII